MGLIIYAGAITGIPSNEIFYLYKVFKGSAEAYLEPCQTSKMMELFAKVVNGKKLHLRCLTGFLNTSL